MTTAVVQRPLACILPTCLVCKTLSRLLTFFTDVHVTPKSWRVLDVTTAMAYALLTSYGKADRSISAACALLRGFHHSYPLTSDERKHLRLLVASRLALSVTFGNYSFKQNPANEYLLLHSKPAWNALNLLWGKELQLHDSIDIAFKIACENIEVLEGETTPECADISFPDPCIPDLFASARSANKINLK